ncbi:M16 family metallopeptidase [Kitasatospora sp. NPDC094011]|uniref:M16 family metallopeptidase n=1 Tax=Kitasatospora sp. NPDC094011 TaxID=3364090 RepID=UPI003826131B
MNHEVIDGVPVLWAEAPGPLEAALLFGCGARDESFRTLGVTHLVEHLAMGTLPRLHHEHNASVGLTTTEFTCSGRPEQVVEFLGLVCRALGALPLERIEREAGVLAAEGGRSADPVTGELLSHRYGVQGVGLAAYQGPGPDRIPVEAVRETLARHFHAGNAVLVLTGPPPAGLRLPLPSGERPPRDAAQPVLRGGAAWYQEDVPSPGLALYGDLDDDALFLAVEVLANRLRETVRHQHGLSYDVGRDTVFVGPGQGERTLVLDAREGQDQRVAELLWAETVRLARDGMSEQELAEELAGVREAFQDPRSTPFELREAAAESLFGGDYRDADTRLASLTRVTPDGARQALAQALRTAVLVVPCGTEPDVRQPDGTPLPKYSCGGGGQRLPAAGRTFRPPLLARLFSSNARRIRLVVDEAGLWMGHPDGTVCHVRYDEVVGVETDGPSRVVFGRNNCFIPVVSDLFPDAGPAVAAIDAAVPESLRYPVSAFRPTD